MRFFGGRRFLPFWALLVLALVWAAYATMSRRAEDRALRDHAMPACEAATKDRIACEARIATDHDACRILALNYHGKGQGTSLSRDTYADCVTRGAEVVRQERVAARKAQEAAARERGNLLH